MLAFYRRSIIGWAHDDELALPDTHAWNCSCKFPPSRRDHYRRLWDADPEGTRQLIDGLAAALPVEEMGAVEAAGPTDYPKEWLGREVETVGTDTAARPTVSLAKD